MRQLSKTVVAGTLLALTGCGTVADGERDRFARGLPSVAEPSAVIATELAFARKIREDGLQAAYRDYARSDAIILLPEITEASAVYDMSMEPGLDRTREPHRVWSSCDGTLAVTEGAWGHGNGEQGRYVTVWQRDRRGDYMFVLDYGHHMETAPDAPAIIAAETARCDETAAAPANPLSAGSRVIIHKSRDGSLVFRTAVSSNCAVSMDGDLRRDAAYERFGSTRTAGAAGEECAIQ